MQDDLEKIATAAQSYYRTLLFKGIPEELARRLVIDWHVYAINTATASYREQLARRAEAATHRLALAVQP